MSKLIEDVKRPPGRPAGSTTTQKSAEALLEQHVKDGVKMMSSLRDFAEEQIGEVRKSAKTISVESRLGIVIQLTDIMHKISQSLQVSVNCYKVISQNSDPEKIDDGSITRLLTEALKDE